jgi:predicted RecB family nuclease
MKNAPCAGQSELFFNETSKRTVEKARSICRGCTEREKCYDYAMSHNDVGVWAGLTSNQREKIRREARKARRNGRKSQQTQKSM